MKPQQLIKQFIVPLIVLAGMVVFIVLNYQYKSMWALPAAFAAVCIGSYQLVRDAIADIARRHFAIDYIAILALAVSLFTGEYLVGTVIALMITSGRTLESYGAARAKASLTKLIERIPNIVTRYAEGQPQDKAPIAEISAGDLIVIRKGEVIPLDGVLESAFGFTDESSITGEPYAMEKMQGDVVRSGTVNQGDVMVVRVTAEEKDSTYTKIIDLVRQAQREKAPIVRLANRYSILFAASALILAVAAYGWSGDIARALAVLVIATPCPLILAGPIALLGGVNAAARKRIIIKRLASLETLARAKALIFDKTGTITIGTPRITNFECMNNRYDAENCIAIAASIERNSLHPLAKAIVEYARTRGIASVHAESIREYIGVGIEGVVNGKRYRLTKLLSYDGMAIGLFLGDTLIAQFHFADELKDESKQIMERLHRDGMELFIFTGDKESAAAAVQKQLGAHIAVRAEYGPEDKQRGIQELKQHGFVTAMVGDGINDAPALAYADVGIVFSNEEQTAASDAADVVLLGGEFSLVNDALKIARRTMRIAITSMWWGMGLSLIGMFGATFGLISPLLGAVLQEGIDVIAILNAMRASRQR